MVRDGSEGGGRTGRVEIERGKRMEGKKVAGFISFVGINAVLSCYLM